MLYRQQFYLVKRNLSDIIRGAFRTQSTSKMELFVKTVNSLTIFPKGLILEVQLSSEYAFDNEFNGQ